MAKPKKQPRRRPEPVKVERVKPNRLQPDVGPIMDNVPMPAKRRRYKYPFGKMNPGQSVNIRNVTMQKVSAAIASHRKRHGGTFRTERQEDGSVQVWKDSD